MSLFSFDSVFLNGSYVDIVVSYWNCIINFLTDKATNINENNKVFTSVTESLLFDDFQWKIFTTFLAIFIINIVIIYISWQIYGKRICNRFMKPGEI